MSKKYFYQFSDYTLELENNSIGIQIHFSFIIKQISKNKMDRKDEDNNSDANRPSLLNMNKIKWPEHSEN